MYDIPEVVGILLFIWHWIIRSLYSRYLYLNNYCNSFNIIYLYVILFLHTSYLLYMRQRLGMSCASTLGDKLSFIGTGRNNRQYNTMFDTNIMYTVTRVYITLSARTDENHSRHIIRDFHHLDLAPIRKPKRWSMIIL